MLLIFTVINTLIFFSNAVLVGYVGKLSNLFDEKMDDMCMLERRLGHYFDEEDSVFKEG